MMRSKMQPAEGAAFLCAGASGHHIGLFARSDGPTGVAAAHSRPVTLPAGSPALSDADVAQLQARSPFSCLPPSPQGCTVLLLVRAKGFGTRGAACRQTTVNASGAGPCVWK